MERSDQRPKVVVLMTTFLPKGSKLPSQYQNKFGRVESLKYPEREVCP
jgi:hypothetical protein